MASPMTNALRLAVLFAVATPALGMRAQDEPQHGWRARLTSASGAVECVVPQFSGASEGGAELELARSGRYRFALESNDGAASLEVRGADGAELARVAGARGPELAWSAWLTLPATSVRLHALAPLPGPTRVWWEMAEENGRGFRAEPIPQRAVTPAPTDLSDEHVEARDLALLANKGCVQCHAGELPAYERTAARAPELLDIGARVDVDWLARWIHQPSGEVAYPDMPDLFADTPADRERARDVAHFLVQQPLAATAESRAADADVARGRGLFHELGCIGCHGERDSPAAVLGDPFLEADRILPQPRRLLPDLVRKWRRPALEQFLREPARSHPVGRMPDFQLDSGEARAIAAYLLPLEPARAAHVPDPARAVRGGEAWKAAGCQSCHAAGGELRERTARPFAELDAAKRCTTARYSLRDGEAARLARGARFAARADDAQRAWLHGEFAFERNGCGACHARAGEGGISYEQRVYFRSEYEETDLGDEGRLPPDLGGVGTKLHAAWIQHVLDTGARARPYLRARMPVYPKPAVAGLGEAFARAEGVVPGTDAREPECSDASARIGRDLLGREQLSCIACHLYKDFPPNGTPGPAFEHFGERLRYEWFRSFLPDPSRAKPGTRMPTFGQAGKSSLTKVHGGDLHKQVDAMWCYFALGEDAPVPPGVERTRSLELVVGERPIVLRTFLEQAGTRGIAVGLPNGLSFAYDANACRLVDAWKGAFLDASGPWADRGGNNAGGQGTRVWQAPSGPPVVLGTLPAAWPETSEWQWRGYSLDAQGVPVFEAALGAVMLRERIDGELSPRAVLRRHFALAGLAPQSRIAFRADPDGELKVYVLEGGFMTMRLSGVGTTEAEGGARIVSREDGTYCELEARADGSVAFVWEVRP
jgi:mono/diheme cytochrome c family protein